MSAQIKITVDGQVQQVAADQRPTHLFQDNAEIVVCKINGELKDLWSELSDGDVVESVAISTPDGLNVLRHSTAHVLAQAVQEVFPETKLGIGPPIRDGFYYDFDPKDPFTPSDLEKLESAMRKIVKAGQRFRRRVTTEKDALAELKSEPYKCELIGLKAGETADESSVEVGGTELTRHGQLKKHKMHTYIYLKRQKSVITVVWVQSWIYFHFQKKLDQAWQSFIQRVELLEERWRITLESAMKKRIISLFIHRI